MSLRYFALSLILTCMASAQSSTLHTLDTLVAGTQAGADEQATNNSISYLMDHLQSAMLQGVETSDIQQTLVRDQLQFLAGTRPGIPEINLILACNAWNSALGLDSQNAKNAAPLHEYRIAMSELSPHLFSRGPSGQVPYTTSPLEAFYIVDTCLAQGGVPHVHHSGQLTSGSDLASKASTFGEALGHYYATTTQQQRYAEVVTLLGITGID